MLAIKKLTFSHRNTSFPALDNIDLTVRPGEFILLLGKNGSGKSTLLKNILNIEPKYSRGQRRGTIFLNGKEVTNEMTVSLTGQIGIVLQDPESQISNLTVMDEMAFGLANLLLPKEEVFKKVAMGMSQLNINTIANQDVLTLSGGQIQRLVLASILALGSKLVLLDEPTNFLDPIGVSEFLLALPKLMENQATVILATHRPHIFRHLATRVIVLQDGKTIIDCPIEDYNLWNFDIPKTPTPRLTDEQTAVSIENIDYFYPGSESPIIRGASAQLNFGKSYALTGTNGSGKSTLLKLLAQLLKPTKGKITTSLKRRIYLPQNPSLGFVTSSCLDEIIYGTALSESEGNIILDLFNLTDFIHHSPHNLSGGQQRLLNLAIAYANRSDLLLLDEPTACLDNENIQLFLKLFHGFSGTLIAATHDERLTTAFDGIITIKDGKIAIKGEGNGFDHLQRR